MNNEISFLMYSLDEEDVNVNVRIAEDTIWLSQKALAELFGIDRTGIGRHLKNIFEEGELDETEVCAKFAHTTEARRFFSTVQNKMHYAIHHHTASELIVNRVDAQKDFMGLTTFKGELPTIAEAKTAKNYLTEKELRGLNRLVSGYLDFAEIQAEREIIMTMQDWIDHVDKILRATGEDVLENAGKVSRSQMEKKVNEEYKKYSQHTLTSVEKDYLEELKSIENIAKRGGK